jgi:hypothetical protein
MLGGRRGSELARDGQSTEDAAELPQDIRQTLCLMQQHRVKCCASMARSRRQDGKESNSRARQPVASSASAAGRQAHALTIS